jgi:hypothetical protein
VFIARLVARTRSILSVEQVFGTEDATYSPVNGILELSIFISLIRSPGADYHIDIRRGDRKKCRGNVDAVRLALTPSFSKPRSSPSKQRNVQPRDAFEDANVKPGFEIVKS